MVKIFLLLFKSKGVRSIDVPHAHGYDDSSLSSDHTQQDTRHKRGQNQAATKKCLNNNDLYLDK